MGIKMKETTSEKKSIVALRGSLGLSQRAFVKNLEGMSASFLGKVERGESLLSQSLSSEILRVYGAWVPPGGGFTDPLEGFGGRWSLYQVHIAKQKRGSVIYANEYSGFEELGAVIKEKQDNLDKKKVRREIWVFSTKPKLEPYTGASFERFQQLGERPDKDQAYLMGGAVLRKRVKLIADLLPEVLGADSGATSEIEQVKKNYSEFIESMDTLLSSLGKIDQIKEVHETRMNSILGLFPGVETDNADKFLLGEAELTRKSFGGSDDPFAAQLRLYEGIPNDNQLVKLDPPVSFDNYVDWSKEGMASGQWLDLYESIKGYLGGE